MQDNKYTRAAEHLFQLTDARPGRLLFVYEESFSTVVKVCEYVAKVTGRDVEFLPVEPLDLDTLHFRLSSADKFLCAFNRSYKQGLPERVKVMTERATIRSFVAYTLADMSAIFFDIFQADPYAISTLNAQLIRALQVAERLNVTNDHGTHLSVTLNQEYDWVNMDCFTEIDFDLTVNLPVGEVATYSPHVEGEIYFTGALLGTIPIGRKYGVIRDPIYMRIENNAVTKLTAPTAALQRDLEFCLHFDDYTHLVNEIGLGTNHGVPKPMLGLNYKYEENALGFHLGFGASLAQQNVKRLTPHHLDLVFDQSVVKLDDVILYDGSYHTDRFPTAFSDAPMRLAQRTCCGLCNAFSMSEIEAEYAARTNPKEK